MFKGEELAKTLSELIKVNTSNPPGNETEVAKLLAEKLSEYGFSSLIIESEKNRGSLIVHVENGEGPSLLLLSHLDVVPAKPEEWKVHPFSGEIKNGFVWGRGALDCKGTVVIELYTFLHLVEEKAFKGKLIFAATADEERGGLKGVKWLLDNKPELLDAQYVINEGGGFEMPVGSKSIVTVQTAEKGVYWFRLKFKGTSGHASIPYAYENAVVKASKAVGKISEVKPRISVTIHAEYFIKELAKAIGKKWIASLILNPRLVDYALKRIPDKSQAAFIEAMLRNTFTPTIVKGGNKENVVPSECEVTVDCRLLPGFDEKWVEQYLKEILPNLDYEIEFIHREPPTESPIDTPLYRAIEKVVKNENTSIVPYISPGGTDSRFFRRLGRVAYGFIPLKSDIPFKEFMSMVHGVNERISIKNLEYGYKTLTNVLKTFYNLVK